MKQQTTKNNRKSRQLRFLIIGAGSRGTAYAEAITNSYTNTKNKTNNTTRPETAIIHAVAEPNDYKRDQFGKRFIWGRSGSESPSGSSGPARGQAFKDWREWVAWEVERRESSSCTTTTTGTDENDSIDGIFICTLDHTHLEIIQAIAPLGIHILCEKPLALSLSDCLAAYSSITAQHEPSTSDDNNNKNQKKIIFSIGHVLRYSPHNTLLRNLLHEENAIGDIVSLEHTEPVGYWHFAHSYVRGNWRRATPAGDGSLLTKSCHDVDFVLWLLCSPPPSASRADGDGDEDGDGDGYDRKLRAKPHHPRAITSTGHLAQFRRRQKPVRAGDATNCLSCPAEVERGCLYSALRIYRDMHLARGCLGWPVDVVCPDIEDAFLKEGLNGAERRLLGALGEDYQCHSGHSKSKDLNGSTEESDSSNDEHIRNRPWYGRCVYESDNNVCDDQFVTITWDDESPSPSENNNDNPNPNPISHRAYRTSKTATIHMTAPTEKQCERRGRIYGTTGELSYDSRSISIYHFDSHSTTVLDVEQSEEELRSHGGGDYGLARSFVGAVDAVVNRGWPVEKAQVRFVGCTLEEIVRSHGVVFAAEEARREEKVVKWREWWRERFGCDDG